MTNEEIEALILHSIAAVRANGGKVVRGSFGSQINRAGPFVNLSKECCALGSITGIKSQKTRFTSAVAEVFGKSEQWIWDFVKGFDDLSVNMICVQEKDAYEMGRRVAAKVFS